jgi:hypothetical protein
VADGLWVGVMTFYGSVVQPHCGSDPVTCIFVWTLTWYLFFSVGWFTGSFVVWMVGSVVVFAAGGIIGDLTCV